MSWWFLESHTMGIIDLRTKLIGLSMSNKGKTVLHCCSLSIKKATLTILSSASVAVASSANELPPTSRRKSSTRATQFPFRGGGGLEHSFNG